MSFFTIAIIVYVALMVVLEVIQSGRRRKTPPLEEYIPEEAVEEIQKKWSKEREEKETKIRKVETIKKEELKITPKSAKEILFEVEKKKPHIESRKKILLRTIKDNDLLKLIIFKEILEPHPLTKKFLFKRRI